MKKRKSLALPFLPLLALISCATQVPVRVLRPAGIDMSGIETIVLLDFGGPETIPSDLPLLDSKFKPQVDLIVDIVNLLTTDKAAERAASYIRSALLDALLASRQYKVVDALEGGSYTPPAFDSPGSEAYVSGAIVECTTRDTESTETSKDQKGVEIKVPVITRSLSLSVEYTVVDARTGLLLGRRSREARASDMAKGDKAKAKLASVDTLIGRAADSIIPQIRNDFISYESLMYLVFEPSGESRPMKSAEALVQGGRYREAREAYRRIFTAEGSLAAGYNAALLLEVLGDRAGAAAEMLGLAASKRSEKAKMEAMRMLSDIEDERRAGEMGIKDR